MLRLWGVDASLEAGHPDMDSAYVSVRLISAQLGTRRAAQVALGESDRASAASAVLVTCQDFVDDKLIYIDVDDDLEWAYTTCAASTTFGAPGKNMWCKRQNIYCDSDRE